MKKALIIALSLMVSLPIFGQEIEQIDLRLLKIRNRDQSVRHNIARSQQKGDIDSLVFYVEQMAKIDAENQKFVGELIHPQGIPDGLSKESYSAIFLVVDHADISYQKRHFKT